MLAACFPREIGFTLDDRQPLTILPFHPQVRADGNVVLDRHRVYLLLEEAMDGLQRGLAAEGAPPPQELDVAVLSRLPGWPVPVAELLAGTGLAGRSLRICLVNGAGGGLGDGILLAPAILVLVQRLRQAGAAGVTVDVRSMMPRRSSAVLAGLPGVAVHPLPMTMAEFQTYDGYGDLSGMLRDPRFQELHMTDFALERFGIPPASVAPAAKRPRLHLGPPPVLVGTALEEGRRRGRPLVAVVWRSSYTRSLPAALAAELCRRLAAANLQPVVFMEDEAEAAAFITDYGLTPEVLDLSAVSKGFAAYASLLAGMDGIVSVDTSAVHVGAALEIPTVGLFNAIDATLRTRYSPAVIPVQLAYRGRRCQAPCGTSKALAFLQGRLADGRGFRLEFGYACDEAVDREGVLAAAAEAVAAVDCTGDVPAQLRSIEERFRPCFRGAAPCWRELDPAAVVAALEEAMARRVAA